MSAPAGAAAASGGVLDMALDDIITTNRKNRSGAARRNGGVAKGNRAASKPYNKPSASQAAAAAVAIGKHMTPSTDKLVVSNLAFSVTERDVRDLFSQIGPVKHASLSFDKDGRSKGLATVTFVRSGDANKALKEYNGRTFDNRPMKIELIIDASSAMFRLSPAVPVSQQASKPKQQRQQQPQQQQQEGGAGGRGRKGGRGAGKKERGPAKTAEELDAEMDTYMNDQTMEDSTLQNALA